MIHKSEKWFSDRLFNCAVRRYYHKVPIVYIMSGGTGEGLPNQIFRCY